MKASSLSPLLAALALFSSPPQLHAADLKKLYQEARIDFSAGRYQEAKTKLQQVVAAQPDLIPARAMLAEITLKEREAAARPEALKIAESTPMSEVSMTDVTIMEALATAKRQIEKAAGDPEKVQAGLIPRIPEALQSAKLSIEVKNVTIQQFVDAVAWAGGAKASYHAGGIVVLPRDDSPAAGPSSAAESVRKAAQQIMMPRLRFDDAGAEEAVTWLRSKAGEAGGNVAAPLIMVRRPLAERGITLDLRNQSLHDALRALSLVSDVVVEYHDWGIGVAPAQTVGGQSQTAGAARPDSK